MHVCEYVCMDVCVFVSMCACEYVYICEHMCDVCVCAYVKKQPSLPVVMSCILYTGE